MLQNPGRYSPARFSLLITTLTVALLLCTAAPADEYRELEILGWVENVWLADPPIKLKAKLDTGAETSSLHSIIVKKFRKDGKRWVRFQVEDPDSGEVTTLVRERERTVGIVQHEGDTDTRPVVLMEVCIAGRQVETQVSLADRSQFIYPVLLGRNTLEKFALIDPGNTFLSDRDCESRPPERESVH